MKVLVINGSPHKDNTTMAALNEVINVLNNEGIETEVYHVLSNIEGCRGCGVCHKTGKCVIDDDVNRLLETMEECDGLLVGSPVYYAGVSGQLINFLDRFFYISSKKVFAHKAAAAISVARRAGNETAFDAINKFFLISNMVVIGSSYWNDAYGFTKEDASKDLEGMQTMRNLGRNMAYYLKLRQLGKQNGLEEPEIESGARTHFMDGK